MPVPATTGQLRTKIEDMEIGDYIPYTYEVTTKGKSGRITEIGASTHSEIPVTGMEVGKGTAYLTKVARGLLCSDRVVQNNISWNELNANKVIQGSTFYLYGSVDGGSLNYDTSKTASVPVPVVFNNELYITWKEYNGTTYQIRVKKLQGSTWVSVDNGSLNYDTSKDAYRPAPIVFNNELYITWYEHNGTAYQIRVKKLQGSTWVSVGNGSLNYDTSKSASYPALIVFNNELYITWYEHNGIAYQIRVKKLQGSTWVSVDGGSLNYDISRIAYNPVPIVFNNELYITWYETNGTAYQIRVKKLQGSTWVSVGNGSLNYDTSKDAYYPAPIVFNNELYITWVERNETVYQIRVKKLQGSTWVSVDGGSLNYDTSKDANRPAPIVFNNELYMTWYETNGTAYQIRVKKLQGSTWVSVDNGSLNYDISRIAYNPVPIVFNNELYITWYETNGTAYQIRVKKYYLTGWIRSLGGGCAYADENGNKSTTDRGFGAWPTNNEWDKYVLRKDYGTGVGRDDVWHWNGVVTWTQDTPITSIRQSSARTCRGYSSIDAFHDNLTNITVAHLGFRPVFEYQE